MLTFSTEKKQSPTTRPRHDSMSGTSHPQHPKIRHILRRPSVQPKLTVGAPNDKYEQEADRVADQIMRMRVPSGVDPTPSDPKIQRICEECEEEVRRQPIEEEEELIQAKPLVQPISPIIQRQTEEADHEDLIQAKVAAGVTPAVTPVIRAGIQSLRGSGQPLPKSERSFFEPRFGTDFSGVRVHSDARAANVAQSISARAFTLGNNVVFGAGEYSSGSLGGRGLLAHELTHVVQQGGSNKIGFKTSIESDPIDFKNLSSWRPNAHHDRLTGEPVQERPVSFGVLNEKFGQPGPAAEPATLPLTSFDFGNIAVTAPNPATPAQAAPTPAPASPAATTKFPIKSSFTVTDKIEQDGPAPVGFGLTNPKVIRTSARTDHVNGVWETPVSVHIAVPWQVGSRRRTDIPSKNASAITHKNYKIVVADLTPPAKSGVVGGLILHAGQPPRTKFWAKDLTIKHEIFHADENVKFGREGADRAQKWLDSQTAQDANEVGAHLDKVPGIAARWIGTKMVKPASELRAYADGAADYQARVDAIKALGDKNGYRVGARRRRARKADDDS